MKNYIDVFSSFIIPIVILGLVYSFYGMYPLGDKTILICDLNLQYVDFFSAYYEILTTDKSIFYSWHAGMGLNFIGLFAYYLSSPFSFLILLFGKQNLTEALLAIILIKIGSAGLMFSVYSRYLFKETGISVVIFSVLYALIAYSIVYSFNLMFLDGVVFLPLVILGVEKILRENKCFLFIISLTIMFIANFYIAYMVGTFSLLYFFVRFLADYNLGETKLFTRKFLLFGLSTILAAGFSAFLWVPTFFALDHGYGDPYFVHLRVKFKLFDLITKLQIASYDTLKFPGLPNIYCGLLPLLLVPLFFFNNRIDLKEKMLHLFLFAFLIISFDVSTLDLVWHAFNIPVWFPFRYSFVFSFLMVSLAYRQFNQIQQEDAQKIFKICAGWIVMILLLQKFDYEYLSDIILVISIFFLCLYTLLLSWLTRTSYKKIAVLLGLTFLILMETSLNTFSLIRRLDGEFGYISAEKYSKSLIKLENIIQRIHDHDQSLYRLEWIGARTMNAPMNLQYKGISHFSSMANSDLNKFLQKLGFLSHAGYRAIESAGLTPISASLLGIKYIISPNEIGLGYKKLFNEDGFMVYENIHALPIGFMVNERLKDLDIKQENPFQLQSDFVNLSMGNHPSIPEYQSHYQPLEVVKIEMTNAFFSGEDKKEIFQRNDKNQEAFVEFYIYNPEDQQVYANFHTLREHPGLDIYLNDEKINEDHPEYNRNILDLGFHRRNDVLKLKIAFNNDEFGFQNRYFYGLNNKNLDKALRPLRESFLEITKFTDTLIEGKILVGKNHLLLTSIPYNPGWAAYIDNQLVPIIKIGESLIGIELEEGKHAVKFTFTPRGLKQGILVSFLTLSGILLFFVLRITRHRNRVGVNQDRKNL